MNKLEIREVVKTTLDVVDSGKVDVNSDEKLLNEVVKALKHKGLYNHEEELEKIKHDNKLKELSEQEDIYTMQRMNLSHADEINEEMRANLRKFEMLNDEMTRNFNRFGM